MDRRAFLGALALSAIIALGGGLVVGDRLYQPNGRYPAGPRNLGSPRPYPRPVPTPVALPDRFTAPDLVRIPLPPGSLYGLPGDGNLLALTVDDGNDSEVVALYAKFAADTGMRITFFVNGANSSWTQNAPALRPLVDSGQVQIANHTWSHPALTSLSDAGIVEQLSRNDTFIRNLYGVEARPYFRPPFGYHDDRVDAVASQIGYSKAVMWNGSFSDSGLIPDALLLDFARTWLLPQHIVIGHANYLPVTRLFDQIVEIIRDRSLVPITLDDLFLRP